MVSLNRTVLLALTMVLPVLAGCFGGDGGDDDSVQACNPQVDDCDDLLKSGQGAIAGLLVDDRFRPIHLTDDAATEFQAEGFVLLQETGTQVKTTENGEFNFLDLDPGTYTLRVTASGHEATPQQVEVVEGEFAEQTVIARRVSSQGSTIVTEEYSAFSPCFINFVALSYTADCTADRSGETARLGFSRNVSEISKNVTWVVAEALFNQYPSGGAAFDVVIRRNINVDFTAAVLWEERYTKLHLQEGEMTPDPEVPGVGFHPWYLHNGTFEMLMFGRGYGAEEIRQAYAPVREVLQMGPCIPAVLINCYQDIPMRRGAGGTMGNEAQFLLSYFIGEPEVDPLEYCALCNPDA